MSCLYGYPRRGSADLLCRSIYALGSSGEHPAFLSPERDDPVETLLELPLDLTLVEPVPVRPPLPASLREKFTLSAAGNSLMDISFAGVSELTTSPEHTPPLPMRSPDPTAVGRPLSPGQSSEPRAFSEDAPGLSLIFPATTPEQLLSDLRHPGPTPPVSDIVVQAASPVIIAVSPASGSGKRLYPGLPPARSPTDPNPTVPGLAGSLLPRMPLAAPLPLPPSKRRRRGGGSSAELGLPSAPKPILPRSVSFPRLVPALPSPAPLTPPVAVSPTSLPPPETVTSGPAFHPATWFPAYLPFSPLFQRMVPVPSHFPPAFDEAGALLPHLTQLLTQTRQLLTQIDPELRHRMSQALLQLTNPSPCPPLASDAIIGRALSLLLPADPHFS
jgi:hypothetical protein